MSELLKNLNVKGKEKKSNLGRLATDKQRFKDILLKQKSQYYKNAAFSVLAISLFIFTVTKIKDI